LFDAGAKRIIKLQVRALIVTVSILLLERAPGLSSNVSVSPGTLMSRRSGDFDDEAENPNGIMYTFLAKDCHSHKMHPVHTAIRPHDAELTRFARGTIRTKWLHRDGVESASILRMNALQNQLKGGRHICRNSEQLS
jgi:hypothetical protein